LESFRRFIRLIPRDGLLIANGDDPLVISETKTAECPVRSFGFSEGSSFRVADITLKQGYAQLKILKNNEPYLTLDTPLYGRHNVSNILSVVALSEYLKIEEDSVAEAMRSFRGIRRRQEIKGERSGILIIDDFAHHPTAVKATIEAVKERLGNRRLMAVFEPRSNSSRRNIFQEKYAASFDYADLVFIPEPPLMEKIPPAERFSSEKLVGDLKERGLEAFYSPDNRHLLDEILKRGRKGDVILIMSNGAFENLPDRLLKRL
jgi:UDP-N-acetylmuramate: L-alanyl-gamma-D-glutamyl-meso-diaminopimelate ligase